MPPWNDGLTGPALKIAQEVGSPLRVLAGPGTGKTYAMMRRVSRFLEEGVAPDDILVCTFTRTAAADLQKSLATLGVPGAGQVRAGTLHSLCYSILSVVDYFQITRRRARPLLDFEIRFMLEDLKSKQFGNIWARRRRLRAFDAAWARMQHEDPGWPADPVDAAFHTEIMNWLQFHRAMLIGELIARTNDYLKANPLAARPVFEHIIVDEFQDLNKAEQVLLDEMGSNAKVTVVGDDDQSIYSFRHAHKQGLVDYDQDHPGTRDEYLIECRRCPQAVVRMANSLIQQNAGRSTRVLVPRPSNPVGDIAHVQWPSIGDEATGLAKYVKAKLDAKAISAGDVLVLAPRRHLGYATRDALVGIGVEARSFFSEQELDGNPKKAGEFGSQERFCLLNLLADPYDEVALRCWIGFGRSDLGVKFWAEVRDVANAENKPVRVVLESPVALSANAATWIAARMSTLRAHEADLGARKGTDLLDRLYPPSEPWAEPFRSAALAAFESDPDSFESKELFEAIRRMVTQPEMPTDVDYVRVMSLHKSKGLTAKLVIVQGLVQGTIPAAHDQKNSDLSPQDHLEEQRRLFFVALTRPTEEIVLSSVTQVAADLAYRWNLPRPRRRTTIVRTQASQFLSELGGDCPKAVAGSAWLQAQGIV